MPHHKHNRELVSLGLRGKLLGLLLAFGVIPLVTAIVAGYAASRSLVADQVSESLEALTRTQAIHVATELGRERLLLRTIASRLPPLSEVTLASELDQLLVQSLPENGVFDGLRIVDRQGTVRTSVALLNAAPHWPPVAPAADWDANTVIVHWEHQVAVAYLVAVPLGDVEPSVWLEGHVRREDFRRVFSIPDHPIESAEAGVFERGQDLVLAAHAHSAEDLRRVVAGRTLDEAGVWQVGGAGGHLVAASPIQDTRWTFVTTLPVSEALAPIARLRYAAALGTGALVLLTFIIGFIAARSVTTPLRELAAAATEFGREGKLVPVQTRLGDEVGALIDSFNKMAEDLVQSREELELLHARDMERAQQLSTVGELASGVAHEIRNPLTGVRGALDLAHRSLRAEDETRPLIEEAQQQLMRMEQATTQLLSYARPPELRELEVDANLLIDRAVNIVAPKAASQSVAIRVTPSRSELTVRVDPELIVQVLVNLILNAVEATINAGEVSVVVDHYGPEAWIAVRDHGAGVSADVRERLFRPFFTTKSQGTGLGLAISREIAARHGGNLRFEETAGGGATFVLTLPTGTRGK